MQPNSNPPPARHLGIARATMCAPIDLIALRDWALPVMDELSAELGTFTEDAPATIEEDALGLLFDAVANVSRLASVVSRIRRETGITATHINARFQRAAAEAGA